MPNEATDPSRKLDRVGLHNDGLPLKLACEHSFLILRIEERVNVALAMVWDLAPPLNVNMSAVRSCPQKLHSRKIKRRAHLQGVSRESAPMSEPSDWFTRLQPTHPPLSSPVLRAPSESRALASRMCFGAPSAR